MHLIFRLALGTCTAALMAGCGARNEATAPPEKPAALVVAVGPGSGIVSICDSIQLTVAVTDVAGATVTPDSLRWSSSDTSLVSISQAGVAVPKNPSASPATLSATAWLGMSIGTGQVTFYVTDSRVPVAPCPLDGSATACVLPCGWHK